MILTSLQRISELYNVPIDEVKEVLDHHFQHGNKNESVNKCNNEDLISNETALKANAEIRVYSENLKRLKELNRQKKILNIH
jgi:hypothetical protein